MGETTMLALFVRLQTLFVTGYD
ncbi:MAG: hypothetical protein JWQ92_2387, partial [Amnibacterium sp.]|nr:hypothetical protein [Amnibacterium sp.]